MDDEEKRLHAPQIAIIGENPVIPSPTKNYLKGYFDHRSI
jgi:hypothetical protein